MCVTLKYKYMHMARGLACEPIRLSFHNIMSLNNIIIVHYYGDYIIVSQCYEQVKFTSIILVLNKLITQPPFVFGVSWKP